MRGARFDEEARTRSGANVLIGVDEAGRGPLAGPVVVAAVALPSAPSARLRRARDSKVMTPKSRDELFGVVLSEALAVSAAWAHPRVIDRVNILQATLRAMGRACGRVARRLEPSGPALVLVDGPRRIPEFGLPQQTVIDGDAKSLCVAAASIVAKVLRDRWMERLDRVHPGYGFSEHKGYSVKAHLTALHRLGPSPIHRFSYAPVAAAAGLARLEAELEPEAA